MPNVLTIPLPQRQKQEEPILDFENLDFKVQVTTVKGKAQSEKRSLTGRLIAWKICDFYKVGVDNAAILDFRDKSKVLLKKQWDETD